jgi:hypothetical protein
VALQGTLDTFELADVLRLLTGSAKTGRLVVRHPGAVAAALWFDGGSVVGGSLNSTDASVGSTDASVGSTDASVGSTDASVDDVMFEMVRLPDGEFMFDPALTPLVPLPPVSAEALLSAAQERLIAWSEIQAVIPSMDTQVHLVPTLPSAEMVIDANRWQILALAAGAPTVRWLGRSVGDPDMEICRRVKDLVEMGLVTVAAARAEAGPESAPGSLDAPRSGASGESGEGVMPGATETSPLSDPVLSTAPSFIPSDIVNNATTRGDGRLGIDIPGYSSLSGTFDDPTPPGPVIDHNGPVELGHLTPAAARAIAAAAQASSDAERDAAIDRAIALNDEPLHRESLLRFLTSVRS